MLTSYTHFNIPPDKRDCLDYRYATAEDIARLARRISLSTECLRLMQTDSRLLWQQIGNPLPVVKYLRFMSGMKRLAKKHRADRLLILLRHIFPDSLFDGFQPRWKSIDTPPYIRHVVAPEFRRRSRMKAILKFPPYCARLLRDLLTAKGAAGLERHYQVWEQRLEALIQQQHYRETRVQPPTAELTKNTSFDNWQNN